MIFSLIPEKPPFMVNFSIVGDKLDKEPSEYGEVLYQRLVNRAAYRAKFTFVGNPLWVNQDGILTADIPFWNFKRWFFKTIELDIDFQYAETVNNSAKLTSFRKFDSSSVSKDPKDTWKLCVTKKDEPYWIDHIILHRGHFALENIINGLDGI